MTEIAAKEYCIIFEKFEERVFVSRYVENGQVIDPPKPIDEIGREFYDSTTETAKKLLARSGLEKITVVWNINGDLD
jgi:hypothetical protein